MSDASGDLKADPGRLEFCGFPSQSRRALKTINPS